MATYIVQLDACKCKAAEHDKYTRYWAAPYEHIGHFPR